MFAITAGAFVPLNFLAVRLAEPLIHPRTFSSAGGLPGSMLLTFLICLAGMALLWLSLVRFELAAKSASARLSRLRRALEGEAYAPPPTGSRIAPGRPLADRLGELDERPHDPARLMPALPLDEAGKYVAAAYVVFVALILVYVAIMAAKLERIERELGELARARRGEGQPRRRARCLSCWRWASPTRPRRWSCASGWPSPRAGRPE